MPTVVPGQYLFPEFSTEQTGSENHVLRYYPGKGATLSTIDVDGKTVPVISATVLGEQVVQELKARESPDAENQAKNGLADSGVPGREFLVSVVSGKQNQYTQFAREVDQSASLSVSATATNLPREGDTVLARITRLTLKQAFCEILCVYGYGNISKDGGLGANGAVAHSSIPMGGGSQILSSYGAVAASQSGTTGAQAFDIGESYRGVIRSQDVRSADRDKVKIVDSFKPGDLVKAVVLSLGDGSNYYLTTARNDLGVVFARSEGGAGDQMVAIDWETMVCEKTGVTERRKCAKLFE